MKGKNHIIVITACGLFLGVHASHAQNACIVETAAELQDALDNCPHNHIIVSSSGLIEVNASNFFTLTSSHSGLRLTIDGEMRWIGGTGCSGCRIIQIDNASNITIDSIAGTGLFTSGEDPSAAAHIADAIKIWDGANITIKDLSFSNLSRMIHQEGGFIDGMTLLNLAGEELVRYGVFVSFGSNIHIESCRVGDPNDPQGVKGTYVEHGYRIYSRTHPDYGFVTIKNCTAHNLAKSGLWIVQGDDVAVDGFTSDSYVRIGPNWSCQDAGLDTGDVNDNPWQRVRRAHIKDVTALRLEIELGTIGAFLDNIAVSDRIDIGRVPGTTPSDTVVARPLNGVRWREVNVTPDEADTDCLGDDIGPLGCRADINGDDTVNVSDLLAVINAWGTYTPWNDVPLGGTCAGHLPINAARGTATSTGAIHP